MDWGIAIGVAVVVVALGGVAAVLWWRLANKAVPYRDGGPRTGGGEGNVVVISDDRDADTHKAGG